MCHTSLTVLRETIRERSASPVSEQLSPSRARVCRTRAGESALREDGVTMAVFLVLLFPLLLLIFAVLMERLEARLQNGSVTENEIEEFLDQARPEEVNTFIREGLGRALDLFRLRRRPRRPRRSKPSEPSH
jgi:hypothetical protein